MLEALPYSCSSSFAHEQVTMTGSGSSQNMIAQFRHVPQFMIEQQEEEDRK
jgi:hypothetical protein